jgi:hypothetical protein
MFKNVATTILRYFVGVLGRKPSPIESVHPLLTIVSLFYLLYFVSFAIATN